MAQKHDAAFGETSDKILLSKKLKKSKNIFAKPIDNPLPPWYNTEEKEVEQAVLTLPYMTRMG